MAQALTLSLRSYGAQLLSHSHAFHQIVLPVDGVLEMEIGGKGGRVAGCQAALIAAGRVHSCEAAGPNRFVVLDWTIANVAGDTNLARLCDAAERRPFLAYDPGLQHLVSFLGNELGRRSASLAREYLWGEALLSALAERASPRSTVPPRQVGKAIDYIRARHRQPLSVEEIARVACCSASHLHALFQRHLGTSPMEHVNAVRLDHAMRLLADSADAISSIALATGHADQSVLTRSMKRRRGVTPAAYRRRARVGIAAGSA